MKRVCSKKLYDAAHNFMLAFGKRIWSNKLYSLFCVDRYVTVTVWKKYAQTSCNDTVIALFHVCLCVTVTVWKKSLLKQAV